MANPVSPTGRAVEKPRTGNMQFVPPPIQKVEDTGLPLLWLQDLVLKVMYFQGYQSGFKIAETIALPFTGIVDQILESL